MAAKNPSEKDIWQKTLRKMLPPGAPFPDEEHLDYSIAVEYQGPPVPYNVPSVEPFDFNNGSIPTTSIISTLPDLLPLSSIPIAVPVAGIWRPADSQRSDSESRSTDDEDAEVRRQAVVRFDVSNRGDTASSRGFSEKETDSPLRVGIGKKVSRRGNCSRCGKGNKLKEKEVCFVCGARFCKNCVLKAMGSMPEGRKCVSCIGQPIEESMRSSLGKCSRILGKVCSPLEVKQIMKAEKECFSNQLRPHQIVVNGRQLRVKEMEELLGCPVPPQKMKPGKYWYDKDSGLWGKVLKLF